MSIEEPLPDYYAILQVHRDADPEIIRAAYRLLMRKYHPDSLPEEQRQDVEILKRVRLINMAYDILSDPDQRAAYDNVLNQQIEKPTVLDTPGLETRLHLVRCANTRLIYRMLLARRSGSSDFFRVSGFELVETGSPDIHEHSQNRNFPALPDGRKKTKTLRNLLKEAIDNLNKTVILIGQPPHFPTQDELQDLFETSATINFSAIDWAGFTCPSCNKEAHTPDGKTFTWCHCNGCGRIFCAGNLRVTPLGVFSSCPWCGRVSKVIRHIKLGDPEYLPVRGEIGRSSAESQKLTKRERLRLPNKKN